jgi:pyochelin biosynthetic protein PchC
VTAGLSPRWFRRFQPAARAWRRLVCFPHAGGAASCFRPWRDHLPPSVDLLAVQYPGREDRAHEPALTDMETMAGRVAEALGGLLDAPVVLFGHSMGAAIAYEVALRVQARCGSRLRGVVLSAHPGPRHIVPGVKHLASDEVLWDELRRLNGTRDPVLENRELRSLLLPSLRSDYRLSETYLPARREPLACRVVACLGDDDPEVTPAEAAAWREATSGGFELRVFPGGDHFYLRHHRQDLVDLVLGVLGVAPWEAGTWPSTP